MCNSNLIITSIASVLALFVSSCNKNEEAIPERKVISFVTWQSETKANGGTFETKDAISVFASADGNFQSSKYASNVKYSYSDGQFVAVGNGITYPNNGGLYFKAVYPYTDNASDTFVFDINLDQSEYESFTASDLMLATTDFCTDTTPELNFSHKMAWLTIKPEYPDSNIECTVELVNVSSKAEVNLTKNTVKSVSGISSTVKGFVNQGYYHFYIPPQTIPAGQVWVKIKYGNNTINCSSSQTVSLQGGKTRAYSIDLSSVSSK